MPHVSQRQAARTRPADTLIATAGGETAVEALQPGDLVQTRDHGLQPVRWIGARRLAADDLHAVPALRPVRIAAGALGPGRPVRDLLVSPEHGILLDDWRAQLLFGADEVLAPARAMLNDTTITRDRLARGVTYHHLMFDRHQIIWSNGVETESFHPDAAGAALDAPRRAELLRLFPGLSAGAAGYGPTARPVLDPRDARVLMAP